MHLNTDKSEAKSSMVAAVRFQYEVWNNTTHAAFSTHACCDSRLAAREESKIPGNEGNLVADV